MRAADWLPLVQRTREPFKGMWALPGERLQANRSLEESAFATLASTTDLHPTYLEQLYTFGAECARATAFPWCRCATGRCSTMPISAQSLARRAMRTTCVGSRWTICPNWPSTTPQSWSMRCGVCATAWMRDVVRQLIAEPFTLGQLHDVVEAVLGEEIDLANFRRKMLASHTLEDTGEVAREGRRTGLPRCITSPTMPRRRASPSSPSM